MSRLILIILLIITSCSEVKKMDMKKISVSQINFDKFPEDEDFLTEALGYYQNPILENNTSLEGMNEAQLAFGYYYIVDGMINGSGVSSILLESFGEYNIGYLKALSVSNNQSQFSNFQNLVSLFEKYKDSFMDQEIPPELDEEANEYDETISEKIDKIEDDWYDNSAKRDQLFLKYLKDNKNLILNVK